MWTSSIALGGKSPGDPDNGIPVPMHQMVVGIFQFGHADQLTNSALCTSTAERLLADIHLISCTYLTICCSFLLCPAEPLTPSLSITRPMHHSFSPAPASMYSSIRPHKRPIRWLERCLLRSSSWLHKRRDTETRYSVLEWRIVPGLSGGINRGISSSTVHLAHATAEAYWPMKCAAWQCPGPWYSVMNGLYSSVKHIKVRYHDG